MINHSFYGRPFQKTNECVNDYWDYIVLQSPFKCPECSYSASYKSALRTHIRTHTGERPFKCPECSYSASQQASLDRHIRTHTGIARLRRRPRKKHTHTHTHTHKYLVPDGTAAETPRLPPPALHTCNVLMPAARFPRGASRCAYNGFGRLSAPPLLLPRLPPKGTSLSGSL